jgi:hypothetical protein
MAEPSESFGSHGCARIATDEKANYETFISLGLPLIVFWNTILPLPMVDGFVNSRYPDINRGPVG